MAKHGMNVSITTPEAEDEAAANAAKEAAANKEKEAAGTDPGTEAVKE